MQAYEIDVAVAPGRLVFRVESTPAENSLPRKARQRTNLFPLWDRHSSALGVQRSRLTVRALLEADNDDCSIKQC